MDRSDKQIQYGIIDLVDENYFPWASVIVLRKFIEVIVFS